MPNFITPVAMLVTRQQYEEDLREQLAELGYNRYTSVNGILCTNWNRTHNNVGITGDRGHQRVQANEGISGYEPELFLAIAAMTDTDIPIVGEYMYTIQNVNDGPVNHRAGELVRITSIDANLLEPGGGDFGRLYSRNHYRKATLQEIVQHFRQLRTQTTRDENFGLTVGMELSSDIISQWASQGLNRFDNGGSRRWFTTETPFSGDRNIEGFETLNGVRAFLVSGTFHVYLRAEGFLEFVGQRSLELEEELLTPPTPSLPESWAVRLTPENAPVLAAYGRSTERPTGAWATGGGFLESGWLVHNHSGFTAVWMRDLPTNVVELSYERFRRDVFSEDVPVTTPMPDFPERWFIRRTADNFQIINDWANQHLQPTGAVGQFVHRDGLVHLDNRGFARGGEPPREYQEITFEQFRTRILNLTPEQEFVLPEVWYVRATVDNAEELNTWFQEEEDVAGPRTHVEEGHIIGRFRGTGDGLPAYATTVRTGRLPREANTTITGRFGYTFGEEITMDQFREHVLGITPFVEPERWVVRYSNREEFEALRDYFEQPGWNYYENSNRMKGCLNRPGHSWTNNVPDAITDGYVELSFEDFNRYIANPETDSSTVVETPTFPFALQAKDAQIVVSTAPKKAKHVLALKWGYKIARMQPIEVTEETYNDLIDNLELKKELVDVLVKASKK